jgi:PIN domain nuclease of toxin-antitoxin system
VTDLLLDTHAWIWSVEDERRLGRRTRQQITNADRGDRLRVSPISMFEVTTLHTVGRLQLAQPVRLWLAEALEHLRLAEFTPAVAADAGQIPRAALPDPLDRILVATARQLNATLLTADTRILRYARETASVRVHDATM